MVAESPAAQRLTLPWISYHGRVLAHLYLCIFCAKLAASAGTIWKRSPTMP